MSVAVLGVDPGVKGGMALLRPDGSIACTWGFTPEEDRGELVGAVEIAAAQLRLYGSEICYFERVGYMPTDGGMGAFTFGRVNGLLEGALRALHVRIIFVTPMMWQARLECLSGGSKNVTKLRAKQLFPAEKITHTVADALLIARYGWERMRL